MLGTPHTVSGVVFDDWNSNGVRDLLEPGISNVIVSLWYLPATPYTVWTNTSTNYVQTATFFTRIGSQSTTGEFFFTCLAAGTYKVGIHLTSTRPSNVTTNQTVLDGMAWTAAFEAQNSGTTEIEFGLAQTIFALAFSLSGDQTVPPTITTTTGAAYAVLNITVPSRPEMYFRIVRGNWSAGQVELPGGFYEGWADQAPGTEVRVLADTSAKKENVWFIPNQQWVNDLLTGRMLVQLSATGSFSDLSRLRGQFAEFRRATYIQTTIPLNGASVVPLVSTSASGNATFFLDINRQRLDYTITYTGLVGEVETSASLNGPASVGQNGPVVYTVPLGSSPSGNISGLSQTFMSWLINGMVYVSIATNVHPNGLLRGQIRSWQQVQYQSVVVLQPQASSASTLNTFGQAVAQLDLQKQTISYYIYYGGLAASESLAVMMTSNGSSWFELQGNLLPAYEDGVKQGFYYLTADQVTAFLQGKYSYVISSTIQTELMAVITNWS